MPSISPTLVHPDSLEDVFEPLAPGFDEPFDGVFTILKAIFLAAHERGDRVILDGGGGDVILGEGSYIVRLLRHGHFMKLAVAEIIAEHRHWDERVAGAKPVPLRASSAFVPEAIKKPLRSNRYRRTVQGMDKGLVDFAGICARVSASKIDLSGCGPYSRLDGHPDYAAEYCKTIWPNMTAGRERYARIAAATGMEARDPFMDKRVIEYCSRLPGRFRFRDGWPKMILREIMADTLPYEVLWTRRKPHLGWLFSEVITKLAMNRGELDITILEERLKGYVDLAALTGAWQQFRDGGDFEQIHCAYVLSVWLRQNASRPVVPDQQFM